MPDPASGAWRVLTGDELGVLLAGHVLASSDGSDRLVATTIVSCTMLGAMAEAAGVAYVETLTGFKWVARAALRRPGHRFVFGYEEALGYAVGDVLSDKDGISAGLVAANWRRSPRRGRRRWWDWTTSRPVSGCMPPRSGPSASTARRRRAR